MSEYKFYSNGKLLLSGEYLILDGGKGLAIPTKYGQNLRVSEGQNSQLNWTSLDKDNQPWFEAVFGLPELNLMQIKGDQRVAEPLLKILRKAQEMNPGFLKDEKGVSVTTGLSFNRAWGLGSSSTLINNIAQWAKVNAFELLLKSFGGSGYDIACAQSDTPIVYQIKNELPTFKSVAFIPEFRDDLYFVYLNKKQVSSDSIKAYRKNRLIDSSLISEVNQITQGLIEARSLEDFNRLIFDHERLISGLLDRPTVQETLFSDFSGQVKSLGAWGGDFVLATGKQASTDYFQKKGYPTVISYKEMIKNP